MAFNLDAIPEPDTLHISMKRGERHIAGELSKAFGGFKRVIIDVDGEQHEFSADSLIRLLEGYEGARDTSRYGELFGTPERAAATVAAMPCGTRPCSECPVFEPCDGFKFDGGVALAEWLRGDAE